MSRGKDFCVNAASHVGQEIPRFYDRQLGAIPFCRILVTLSVTLSAPRVMKVMGRVVKIDFSRLVTFDTELHTKRETLTKRVNKNSCSEVFTKHRPRWNWVFWSVSFFKAPFPVCHFRSAATELWWRITAVLRQWLLDLTFGLIIR